jgi:hypothetical protein
MFDFFKGNQSEKEEKQQLESQVAEPKQKKLEEELDDPVEKIFSFFFGQKEEEPMGMKRFGRGKYPKIYFWGWKNCMLQRLSPPLLYGC